MEVSANHSDALYAGTGFKLTCTITLDPNVDSREDVIMTWSGPRDIPGVRYFIMMSNDSEITYTSNLTISPLAEDVDDGQYTCNVTIRGGANVLDVTGNGDINITTMGNVLL